MAGGGMGRHTGANEKLKNVMYPENSNGSTSSHHSEKSMETGGPSGSKIDVRSDSGLKLWVDLKVDNNNMNGRNSMGEFQQLPPLSSSSSHQAQKHNKFSDLLMEVTVGAEGSKEKIAEVASKAMEELTRLALSGEPLWEINMETLTEMISELDYLREFGDVNATLMDIVRMVEVRESQSLPSLDTDNSEFSLGRNQRRSHTHDIKLFMSESSRGTVNLPMSPESVVELMMDVSKWSEAFCSVVSQAALVGVVSSSGVEGNYDQTLQVMTAEFHAHTLLVPTRESYFARYCKQFCPGIWGVVDVSLEKLFQFPSKRYRRQPSGCFILDMHNGWSHVLWVEHVEVDNKLVHRLYEPVVTSGFAFGAIRWVDALFRHCCWLETLRARRTGFTSNGVYISEQGRRSILKLAERMVRDYCTINVSASADNKWMPLAGGADENVKVSTRKNLGAVPGRLRGTTLAFTTSLLLPFSRKDVFDYLRDENSRKQWDLLGRGQVFDVYASFEIGQNPANCVSILRGVDERTREFRIFYLQVSYTEFTGSDVVFAPIDNAAVVKLIEGGNPDEVAILASGFSVLSDQPTYHDLFGGSLFTMAFHIPIGPTDDVNSLPPGHVSVLNNIIFSTVVRIKGGLESMIPDEDEADGQENGGEEDGDLGDDDPDDNIYVEDGVNLVDDEEADDDLEDDDLGDD